MKQIKLILVLILIVFGVMVFILGMQSLKDFFNSGFSFNTSKTTVIKQIRGLNKLETASFTIEKVIDGGTSGNQFQQLLFGDRILLIAHGEVIAGVDLSKLKNSDVIVEGNTVKLILPKPEILVTRLDNDQTRVYDRSTGLLNRGDKDLESKARETAEQQIKGAACTGNILNIAAENARKQLTALFKAAGFTTVIIDIPQGSC